MRNLLLLLILANVLYFMWGMFIEAPSETGIAIVDESKLGPPLEVTTGAEGLVSVGEVLGSGKPADLAAVVGRSCVTIGPFKSNAAADAAQVSYQAEGMRASVRTTQGQVFVGHWVQIRNIASQIEGDQMLAVLQAGGLEDAYMVNDPDEGYKISLGLFGEMTGAERKELQAKSLDLAADITPRMREATVFFIDIGLPPGIGAEAMMEKYGEERVLLREKAVCPRSE